MALLLVTACAAQESTQGGAATASPASPTSNRAQAAGGQEILASIDGDPITVADLEEAIVNELATLDVTYGTQRHQLLKAGVEQAVRRRLIRAEAERQGTDYDTFVASRFADIQVTGPEVEAWYGANQGRLQGRPLEMLRPAIQQFLVDQKQEQILAELADELGEAREVEMLLEPFRVDVATVGHPTWGDDAATVTLVEFSDFECPYCAGFTETLQRIKREYEGRIRLVFRQFPLTQIHPNAMKAAEASLCAAEQEQFWPFHDVLFADQQGLGVSQLKEKARQVGMDGQTFDSCLDSGRHTEAVEADLQAGARLGVSGTPALFVNGRPAEGGAVGFEAVAAMIEDELARAR
jgi:predicted DsbA family dithiol-disulfide isomerase